MKKKALKIPREIPKLLEKTLVICLAHDYARVYLFHLKKIEELNPIHTEGTEYAYSDKEGLSFFSRAPAGLGFQGEATIPGESPHNKQHYQKVFFNYFVKELQKLFNEGKYDRVIIFVPQDVKNTAKNKLEHHMAQKTEFIIGNFTKHPPMRLVEKIYEEKPHLFPAKIQADKQEKLAYHLKR